MLVLSVGCAALAHCIQLDDGVPKTWGTAERINPNGNAPDVAVDPAGDAVAVWSDTGGIFSRRYTPTDGWSTVVPIHGVGVGLGPAMVAVGADGHALAVWSFEWVGANILCSPSNASGEWDPAEQIDDGEGEAFEPQISMGADGSAVAVWTQFDGERDDVWSNRYTRRDGWSFARRIETSTRSAVNPQVAVDAQGRAVAVWEQSDGTRNDIWSNRYAPSDGWAAAERIETQNGEANSPQVAIDPSGNALAVWGQWDGTRTSIWSSRYSPTRGWDNAELIEREDGGDASSPEVAVSENGNAVAVWAQSDGIRYGIWSSLYTPSRGWGAPRRLDAGNTANAAEPRVAVDPSGSAVAAWRESSATGDRIWSNRYASGSGWGTAERIDSDGTGARSDPRVGIDAKGNAIAVWSTRGGSSAGIWFNRLE